MEITKIVLTTFLSVIALFIITKIMGHKQVAQLDFFDYISGITIGSIGAELATELEKPYKPLIALVIYGSVSYVLNLCAQKIPKTRKYINGAPTILFNDGKLYRQNLKKSKLDLSEFMLLCREQGYFDLGEIQTAIFEHNGKLSILPYSNKRPATPEDLNLTVKDSHIGTEVIMDGRIMGENILRMGLNEKWLIKQVKAQNFKSEKDIFLGIYHQHEDKLTLYPNEV
ncbi:MAG: DUF421 domain-containing protein [Clostridia bacterium]|nr:DUF421 domain-containing protein [Clostridia bacterium]